MNNRTLTLVIIITSIIAITLGYAAIDQDEYTLAAVMTAILILNIFLLPDERYQ